MGQKALPVQAEKDALSPEKLKAMKRRKHTVKNIVPQLF